MGISIGTGNQSSLNLSEYEIDQFIVYIETVGGEMIQECQLVEGSELPDINCTFASEDIDGNQTLAVTVYVTGVGKLELYNITSNTLDVTFPIQIHEVVPVEGSVLGGYNITVNGSGFPTLQTAATIKATLCGLDL